MVTNEYVFCDVRMFNIGRRDDGNVEIVPPKELGLAGFVLQIVIGDIAICVRRTAEPVELDGKIEWEETLEEIYGDKITFLNIVHGENDGLENEDGVNAGPGSQSTGE